MQPLVLSVILLSSKNSFSRAAASILVLGVSTSHQVPGIVLVVLDKMMKAQTTESEKTDTQVFSVYISMASVNEKRVRLSAQLRSLSASAA